jgi:hypothetical protein
MGGKTGTTTQQSSVSIPPEILARYNSVNARAENVANQQFTPYGGQFVAPLTGTQQAGISNINQAQGMATPYYDAAGSAMNTGYQMGSGLALASAGQVNPEALTGQNINQYMSPYLDSVVGSTMANLRQQQGEEQSKILGNQITSGAFGGDRGRIAQANLARQQGLATGQTVSGLMNQGYGQALQTAQQQQAQQLAASQANRAALAGAGQSLYSMGQGYGQGIAGLGTQSFDTALKGAQAQIGAGTLEQQTQQAQNTADYNQFLQQQGYPFQVAQFLANIAMGTGALSGSSQQGTTTSPQSFFSDRRLKDDIEKIGKTFDGQDIVRYKYKGEPGTRIGLIAQDVEKHHPEAVGLAGGYRTVDYDKATDDAAKRGHFADGGLAGGYSSEGGAVMPEMAGMGFAAGGAPDINSMMAEILNAHQGMYPYGKAGLYGQSGGRGGAYGTSQMQAPTRNLMRVDPSRFAPASQQLGAAGQAMQGLNTAERIGSAYTSGSNALFGSEPTTANPQGGRGAVGRGGNYNPGEGALAQAGRWLQRQFEPTPPPANTPPQTTTPPPRREEAPARRPEDPPEVPEATSSNNAAGGLVRGHYAMGGLPFSEVGGYIPDAVLKDDEAEKNKKAMDSFTPKPAGAGQSGSGSGPGLLGGLGQIGGAIGGAKALGSAASAIGEATGATEAISAALPAMMAFLSDRRLKDDIEKIGKTFDGQDIVRYRYKGEPATQIGLIAQDVEKHHPDAVGLAGGYRTVDYRKATEDAADRGHFAGGGLAGVRHGYALDGEVLDEVVEPKQAGLAGAGDLNPEVERIRNALSAIESSGRYNAVGRDVVRPGRPTDRAYGRYQVMGENVGPWTEAAFGQRMSPDEFLGSSKAQDAVVRNRIQQGLDRYGNPQDVASVWFTGQPVAQSANNRDVNIGAPEYLRRFQAAYDANNTSAAAPEGRTGLRVPVSSDATGLGAAQFKDSTGDGGSNEATDYRAEVRRALNPEPREAPNWMQRNQDWLVPLLSGVGAMASSPSRYLGAALLQGVGGGAQQYAAMQQRGEEQQRAREQLGVSRAQTLVSQQREQVAEQQLREQMIQRILLSFGNLRGDGTYLNPYNGQLVLPAERMRIATQIANGASPSGTPSRATAPSENAPGRGEGEGAPATPTTTSGAPAAPSTTAPVPEAPAAPTTSPASTTPAAPATATPDPLAPPAQQPLPQFRESDDPQRMLDRAAMYEHNQRFEEARFWRETADKIYRGDTIPRDVNNRPYYGFQNDTTRQAVLREDIPRIQAGARTHLANYDHVKSSLDNLITLSQNNQMGTASSNLQRVSGIIQTILGENTPAGWSNFTSAVAEGNKEAARLAFSNLALTNMSRGTNMALQEMIMATPGPDMPPQARYNVLTRAQALLQREHEFQNDILTRRPPHMTAAEYQAYWERANPLSRFENTIRQNTPAFVGMSAEQVRQSGAAGRIPDNLRQFRGEGLAFDRETMRWQDSNGNLYNYDGTAYRPRP